MIDRKLLLATKFIDGSDFVIEFYNYPYPTLVCIRCKDCGHASHGSDLTKSIDPDLSLSFMRWALLHGHCRWHGNPEYPKMKDKWNHE